MKFIPIKAINHSATSFKTFLEICERMYAHSKTQPWTGSVDAARGDQIHCALEKGIRRAIAHNGPFILGDLAKEFCADNEPASRIESDPCRWPLSTYELGQWLDRAIVSFADVDEWHEAEEWARADIPGCERPLVAKLDAVCTYKGVKSIWDHKSTKSMGKKLTPYAAQRDIQGLCYSWMTGIRQVIWSYFTANHDAELVVVNYSDQEIANFEKFMVHHAQMIERKWETQDWRHCQPGGLCQARWCSLYDKCYPKITKEQ